MALNIKKNKTKTAGGNSGPRELIPADRYPARLVQIIDAGLHNKVNYKTKAIEGQRYRVRFTYELLNIFMKDEEGNDIKDKPLWISEWVNIPTALGKSDAPSQSWYGNCGVVKRARALTGDHTYEVGDLSELLGLPCAVLVVHDKKNERTYDNVGDVGSDPYKMMGVEAPALVNEAKMFDLENPDMEVFNALPDFIKAAIVENLEFSGSPLDKLLDGSEASQGNGEGSDDPDDHDPDTDGDDGGDGEAPASNEPVQSPW